MSSRPKTSRWIAAVAVGLAGLTGVGVVAAVAGGSAAGSFELVLEGRHEAMPVSTAFPNGLRHTGTFSSGVPFCASGTAVDVTSDASLETADSRVYTCDDGSGTLTIAAEPFYEHNDPWSAHWSIVEGTGRYAGLRGQGAYRGEIVSGDPSQPLTVTYRSTLQGVADADAVAPTIAVVSAKATKLGRPAGAYSLKLTLMIRDDVEGNPVAYTLTVVGGGAELARKTGTTASLSVSATIRVRPASKRVRTLRIQVTATDPVGNEASYARSIKLPR
jgi:hypothetical protein